MTQASGLFWRALLAFLALPTVVAGVVPWLLAPRGAPFHRSAVIGLILGAGLLLWCVRDFYVAGRGTLAPWAPPTNLVTVGLYRVSRNPMYMAVLVILASWATGFRSITLSGYAAAVSLAFHLRIVWHEEPWLARAFGAEWLAYRARVPRWFGRRSRHSARPASEHRAATG